MRVTHLHSFYKCYMLSEHTSFYCDVPDTSAKAELTQLTQPLPSYAPGCQQGAIYPLESQQQLQLQQQRTADTARTGYRNGWCCCWELQLWQC